MGHLEDEQIQAYLDNSAGDEKEKIEQHLIKCSDCRSRAAQYESLYATLNINTTDILSPDFTDSVMSKIAGDTVSETSPSKDYSLSFAFAGIALLISVVIYFVDLSKLIFHFESINLLVNLENYFQNIGARTAEYIPFDTNLTLMVVLTLAALKAIDFAIQHYRRKSVTFVI